MWSEDLFILFNFQIYRWQFCSLLISIQRYTYFSLLILTIFQKICFLRSSLYSSCFITSFCDFFFLLILKLVVYVQLSAPMSKTDIYSKTKPKYNTTHKVVIKSNIIIKSNFEMQNAITDLLPEYCTYCNDPAELMCGRCEEVYYCKTEHQKIDWRRHSQECSSYSQRRRKHLESKKERKAEIFLKLSRGELITSIKIATKLIEEEKAFLIKYPKNDIQLEIQYGSSYCLMIRLLIASKEFSTAQDILTDYFKEKNSFLSNSSNICSKEQLDEMRGEEKEREMVKIAGKLRLISTMANLMHELIRNSVDIFQILIQHFEKVYGCQSLELANIYFYAANYLKFLNQNTKALACFLKSAKLRKEKGGTAYYNVALLLVQSGRKRKALEYFQKALELIEKEENIDNEYVIPQIYENIALIYLGQGLAKSMIDFFQRAYFYYIKHKMMDKADYIMKFFQLIRQEAREEGSEDMKMIQFTKQRKEKRHTGNISNKNRQKYKNADKVAQEDGRKTAEWHASFKQLKLNYNEPNQFKPPKELEYLFGNDLNRHDEQDHSISVNDKYRHDLSEGLNMDLNYMKVLSSNQVGYLHELNRLLMDCKDPAAYFDIVENSNFYQAVDRDKLNFFYKLNPRLVRPTDLDRRLMLQVKQDENRSNDSDFDSDQEMPNINVAQPPKTPKLDLSKLKPNHF